MKARSLLLGVALALFSQGAGAVWRPDLLEAVNAVAHGKPTAQQRALVFRENFAINMMMENGHISQQTFDRIQGQFNTQAQTIAGQAANDAGLSSRLQRADPNKPATFKSGTDVDVHAILEEGGPKQEITFQDMKNARDSFNNRTNAYLVENGLPPLENPAQYLTVDIMPAEAISTAEFARTAEYINAMGGTMYRDPVAARVEAWLRGAKVPEPSLLEMARYVAEQQRQIMAHDHTQHLVEEIKQLLCEGEADGPGSKPDTLRGKVQLEAEQTGKYQERINRAATKIAEKYGIKIELAQTWGRAASEIVTEGRGMGHGLTAGYVDSLRANTTQSNTGNFIDALIQVAEQKPELRGEVAQAIAESTRNLPPSQRGQVLDGIGNAAPDANATTRADRSLLQSETTDAMRSNAAPDAPDRLNSVHAQAPPPPGIVSTIRSADARVGAALGVSELGPGTSALRSGANRAIGGAMTGLGVALGTYELGRSAGDFVEGVGRAWDSNTSDEEYDQAIEQAEGAGWTWGAIGTAGVVAEAAPVAGGGGLVLVGTYMGTRVVLANTETGRAIDEGATTAIDAGLEEGGRQLLRPGDDLVDGPTLEEAEADYQLRMREDAYRRAFARGDLHLAPGKTIDDLLKHLRESEPRDYLTGLAELLACEMPFEIVSVSRANVVKFNTDGTDTEVYWKGRPKFPVRMVFMTPQCPRGWQCPTVMIPIEKEVNPVVRPRSPRCLGQVLRGPVFNTQSLYLEDSSGKRTQSIDVGNWCVP